MERPTGIVGELRHGILSVADALAQSVALLSLALGVAFASSAAAGEVGIAAPFAYLIAGVGSLCLAAVIIRFTRRMASAGGLYTYISRGLNPSAGFLGGWLYGSAFAVGISFVLVIGAFFMSTAMTAHTSIHWGWYAWFFIFLAALALLAFLDIRISTRLQLVAAAVGVGAILLLAIVIAAKGGDSGFTFAPLNPANASSTSNLFLAVVLTFTGFIGFEAAAVLGEETADPLRAIPKAILTAVLVAIVYYVFVTWMMGVGYGANHAAAWAKDPAALDTLATRYVGNWLAVIIDFSVAASGFIAALGGLHLTSRTLFAMGREGGLPRAFAWTHPRFKTPWVGIAFSLVVTLLLGAVFAHHYDPITYFIWMATCATIGILITYIMIALSGIVYFARERGGWNPLLDLVIPAGAVAICGYTLYKSIHPTPGYTGIVKWAPWVALIWLAAGVVIDVVLTAARPERVKQFGSILGASEGAPAEPLGDTTPAPAH
ncbi:MAG TPA: APC family permease [Gaiellaceae bacterium]|jgi:amino acid transporter|nr:APC family permease [Gaiellaceae bacterium]